MMSYWPCNEEAWELFKRERPDLWEEPVRLSDIQQEFTAAIGELIHFAYQNGYGLTFGTAYRDPKMNAAVGGHKRSLHLSRLAVDFNVFKDGEYLQGEAAEKAHNELHDFWDTIGGAGRIPRDLNHYSFAYGGMR